MLRFFFCESGVYSTGSSSDLVTLGSLLYHCKETSIVIVQFIQIILDVPFWWCSYPKSQCQEDYDIAQIDTSVQSQMYDIVHIFSFVILRWKMFWEYL